MEIRYVCSDCRKKMNISGWPVINEVGRKRCDACGSNQNDLESVSKIRFDEAIKKLKDVIKK